MKKIIAIIFCIVFLFNSLTVYADETTDNLIEKTVLYLCNRYDTNDENSLIKKLSETAGDSSSDWLIITLKSCNVKADFSEYEASLIDYVSDKYKSDGTLSKNKATEYHRIILTLIACGADPSDINGINLYSDGIFNNENLFNQGITACIWALQAVKDIEYDGQSLYSVDDIIRKLLSYQCSGGGFSFSPSAKQIDVDLTAMAVNSLLYYADNNSELDSVIKNSLEKLKECQNSDGSFSNCGNKNAESTAQVLSALCTFYKLNYKYNEIININEVFQGLLSFKNDDNGFFHDENNLSSNLMSTYQSIGAIAEFLQLNVNDDLNETSSNTDSLTEADTSDTDITDIDFYLQNKSSNNDKNLKYIEFIVFSVLIFIIIGVIALVLYNKKRKNK